MDGTFLSLKVAGFATAIKGVLGIAVGFALARALETEPRTLLLDEPFAALDPALRIRMRGELDALQRLPMVLMVLITHDPEDARIFGDQMLQLQGGAVVHGAMLAQ